MPSGITVLLIEAAREDIGELVRHYRCVLRSIRALEAGAKGLKGLASILKRHGDAVEALIIDVEEVA